MSPEQAADSSGPPQIIAQSISVSAIHDNSTAEIITITVDRLQLILVNHEDGIAQRNSWHTPLGMLLGMIVVIFFSDFRPVGPFSADMLTGFFYFVTLALFVWTILEVRRAKGRVTVEKLVEKIKRGQPN
jgi:hypothetical protein